ncbi:class I SAM-dependent methyltransferase [Promicromonospora iranensis]|uniref:SAM-dependent methyltransferase n=1 Tax=Promicromonospora iranensis TaxID=1105144 RepID=A0ABU2CJL2_9MICO|nr:class I SAM-dependent methyltransferase [Promicromonospora iranensis]MDR7381498.1 SAM-dependent methyltransferase [Promicromonospora iranensis]
MAETNPDVNRSHELRAPAGLFGVDAEHADRAGPAYPDSLIRAIVQRSPGGDVLDAGIGTGIAAGQLRDAGCAVTGVEADVRVAEVARGAGFAVDAGRFEDWDPEGQQFDAVVAGQSWHRIDPVAGASAAVRALRPGGLLVVFWNAASPPVELAAAFGAVYERVLPELPFRPWAPQLADAYDEMCIKAAAGMRESGELAEPEHWLFDSARTYTRHEWLDHVRTAGGHGRFPEPVLAELLAGLGEVVDEAGGTVVMPYRSVAVATHRH